MRSKIIIAIVLFILILQFFSGIFIKISCKSLLSIKVIDPPGIADDAVISGDKVIIAGHMLRNVTGIDAYVVAVDMKGKPLWNIVFEGFFGISREDRPLVIEKTGSSYIVGGITDYEEYEFKPFIMKVSEGGELLWINRYLLRSEGQIGKYKYWGTRAHSIVPDGSYYFVGARESVFGITYQGRLLWGKYYLGVKFNKMIKNRDELVLVGWHERGPVMVRVNPYDKGNPKEYLLYRIEGLDWANLTDIVAVGNSYFISGKSDDGKTVLLITDFYGTPINAKIFSIYSHDSKPLLMPLGREIILVAGKNMVLLSPDGNPMQSYRLPVKINSVRSFGENLLLIGDKILIVNKNAFVRNKSFLLEERCGIIQNESKASVLVTNAFIQDHYFTVGKGIHIDKKSVVPLSSSIGKLGISEQDVKITCEYEPVVDLEGNMESPQTVRVNETFDIEIRIYNKGNVPINVTVDSNWDPGASFRIIERDSNNSFKLDPNTTKSYRISLRAIKSGKKKLNDVRIIFSYYSMEDSKVITGTELTVVSILPNNRSETPNNPFTTSNYITLSRSNNIAYLQHTVLAIMIIALFILFLIIYSFKIKRKTMKTQIYSTNFFKNTNSLKFKGNIIIKAKQKVSSWSNC